MKIIEEKVKLLKCLHTETRHFEAGRVMRVIARSDDGTYMLARPRVVLDGVAAIFGEIHSVRRTDFAAIRAETRRGKGAK